VDAVGAKYATPASLNFGQGAANIVSGNTSLVLSGAQLLTPATKSVSLDPLNGSARLIPATATDYTFKFGTSTGLINGTVIYNGGTNAYRGILLNKGANAGGFGYFQGPVPIVYGVSGQTGNVSLYP